MFIFLTTTIDCQELFPPNQFYDHEDDARGTQQENLERLMLAQKKEGIGLGLIGLSFLIWGMGGNKYITDCCGFCGLQFIIKRPKNKALENPDKSLLSTTKEIAIKWGTYQVAACLLEQLSHDLFSFAPLLENSLIKQHDPSKVALGLLATIKVIDAYLLNSRYSILDPLSRSLWAYQLAGIIPLQFTRSSVVELLYPHAVDLLYAIRNRIGNGRRPA